jgi:diaminohydroxyphosphoribosylaminopyrimidine deaminase/5-amino-6-(5-phosphoribosylamino)uracil reductase
MRGMLNCVFRGTCHCASDIRMPKSAVDDLNHMRAALALARRGLGTTWPNPSVGCVLVRDGRVIGRGYTGSGGRPHAEPTALSMAGDAARGATAYVTLEPCCHWGQTPPCTNALIQAGVRRVVIATLDPDNRVNSQGVARLREAGVIVEHGLLEADAREDLRGFLLRVTENRPLITLKLASTLDGKIATGTGESQWITGPEARHMAHILRGRHDAVLAGVGTVVADDPELTCRVAGFRSSHAVRVIVDSHLRTPLISKLARTVPEAPLWFLVRDGADPARLDAFTELGAIVIQTPHGDMRVDLPGALKALAAAGLTRVLVEGGAQIAASFLRAGLVDRIAWFHAPAVMGEDGWPAIRGFVTEKLAMMPRFIRQRVTILGNDTLTEFKRSI